MVHTTKPKISCSQSHPIGTSQRAFISLCHHEKMGHNCRTSGRNGVHAARQKLKTTKAGWHLEVDIRTVFSSTSSVLNAFRSTFTTKGSGAEHVH
ncbi:hypothetical protein KIN20_028569 [Parelaphostrongylus tenuis]|uniref:Uncharacterized protein n=1 Tax=Parelaphostrongylus tenuis TaxID=148309 RepID=A0AAD5R108_PARTN|nr:hypothetical protein KIN20_028569 [Parelaphostrongylus tenuis]